VRHLLLGGRRQHLLHLHRGEYTKATAILERAIQDAYDGGLLATT